jgi:hypothetical protein
VSLFVPGGATTPLERSEVAADPMTHVPNGSQIALVSEATADRRGGILSPLLANIALSVLDEHVAEVWQHEMATRVDRARRRRHGQSTYRLVRYAYDLVVMVAGIKRMPRACETRWQRCSPPSGYACRKRRR